MAESRFTKISKSFDEYRDERREKDAKKPSQFSAMFSFVVIGICFIGGLAMYIAR